MSKTKVIVNGTRYVVTLTRTTLRIDTADGVAVNPDTDLALFSLIYSYWKWMGGLS
jgi:hypothetical protein